MADMTPARRFEWERLVRRLPLIPSEKVVAFALATYADPDGTRVRPGEVRLAAVTGLGVSTVRRALCGLRYLGVVERTQRGSNLGRRAVPDVYRLTFPADLLERVELLPPDEVPEPVDNPGTPPAVTGVPTPSEDPSPPAAGGDNPGTPPADDRNTARSGRLPDQDQPLLQPDHSRLSSTVTPPTRDAPVDNDDDESQVGLPDRCQHGLRSRLRDDGRPSCALCRRQTPTLRLVPPADQLAGETA